MPRPTPAPETKVCAVCGREYERPRYRNGMLQNPKAWEIRQTCGPKCGQRLGGRITNQAARDAAKHHPPCPICGDPIIQRENEPLFRWKTRPTCGKRECYRAHMSARLSRDGKPKAPRAPRAPKAPKAPAAVPPRRVAFERFPTPAAARSTWRSVVDVGPPLPPAHATPRAPAERPPELREVIALHPALAAALAGLLTDSWMPYGGAAVRHSPVKRR